MTQTLTIPQLLELALQYQQAGELPQAEQLYRQVLQLQPTNADVWHLLGVLAHQMQSSPLMDATTFTRHLEKSYRQMWEKWCRPEIKDASPD